jgi:dihydroxy-acid dehydratase
MIAARHGGDPGGARRPLRAAEATGARRCAAHQPIRPSQVITPKRLRERAARAAGLGGSTNAVIHLTAIAGRLGIRSTCSASNDAPTTTPVLVDLKPTGSTTWRTSTPPAACSDPAARAEATCCTWTPSPSPARRWASDLAPPRPGLGRPDRGAARERPDLAGGRAWRAARQPRAGRARSSSAPRPTRRCSRSTRPRGGVHFARGPGERIDDPDLDVTRRRHPGAAERRPQGRAGMPEAGYLPIPKKLARQGVKDMVRISDARMSGTAFGTIVLHVTPEAAAGGPLALVRTGDRIRLSGLLPRRDRPVGLQQGGRRCAGAAAGPHHGTGLRGSRGRVPLLAPAWRCRQAAAMTRQCCGCSSGRATRRPPPPAPAAQ